MSSFEENYGKALAATQEESLRKQLAELKAERRMLIETHGNRGQKHPMAVMIGGLNPAAMRLHSVRASINELEQKLSKDKGPKPRIETIPGIPKKGHYGLKVTISYRGVNGKMGTDNFGKWYGLSGEPSDVIFSNEATESKARDAFIRWVNNKMKASQP